MGFKQIDLNPIAATGPTTTTPYAKDVVVKAFTVSRADTVPVVKCVIPADATIIDIRGYSNAPSNAGTAAAISVGIPGSSTYFLNSVDVKASGKLNTSALTGIFNLENLPVSGDIAITGSYAESGAASNTGGPFYFVVEYVR
jgi:hypothetical protein